MDLTFLWHDYETWGADPRRDRPAQFAAIRTDAQLKELGEPEMFFCKPPRDALPSPVAARITGLTPQHTDTHGLREADFFARIYGLFSPGTVGVGYNTLRFDDEVTRFGLYRNFFPPYEREFRDGRARWDLLDLARMARALRPDGVVWPTRPDGAPSFRLEDLTAANGLAHEGAHDALVDVRATIALARLLKQAQPKLWDYYLSFRAKRHVESWLRARRGEIFLHISGMFPALQGSMAPVIALGIHPLKGNEVVLLNLRQDPAALLAMSPEEIAANLYAPRSAVDERVGLKTIHLSRSPALAPVSTLQGAPDWGIDLAQAEASQRAVEAVPDVWERVSAALARPQVFPPSDADVALYSGFILGDDARMSERLRALEPAAMATRSLDDPRLTELLFRFRARNWPETLSAEEAARWEDHRAEALFVTGPRTFSAFDEELEAERREHPERHALWEALSAWAAELRGDLREPSPF